MCGITGFIGVGDQSDLLQMMTAIRHRGPDGDGMHIDLDMAVFLGHLRLSILDHAGGKQPMTNSSQTIWVTYNGEIYNHEELRRELVSKGYQFKSDHSDTEVLVHGWQEWGESLPLKLNGMFAFCIYDVKAKTVFLSRDRFGEKPLYWAFQDGNFYFGSEITAIAAHSRFRPQINQKSLKKFFAYNYIPSPNSILEKCWKLPAGHSLTFDLSACQIKEKSYWQYRNEVDELSPSIEEAAEEIETLLIKSTKRRLMSDVPLGVFLSGGVDSSAVAACMTELKPAKEVQSFSIGFNEKSFDESAYARTMANFLNLHHNEKILDFGQAQSLVPHVLSKLDEPMGDGSLLPTYLLCEFASKQVKVALSGDAGDEIFAGYDPFRALKPAGLYCQVIPSGLHKGIKRLVNLLPQSTKNMSLDFKLRRVLMGLDYSPEIWNPVWMSALSVTDLKELFHEEIYVEELYSEAIGLWQENSIKGNVDKTQEYYVNYYLPDDILTKVDRASMLNGLEARSVFLDNDLVDFARTLPISYKFDGQVTKKVLKLALSRMVPQDILDRPKKGFGIPLMEWLKNMDNSLGTTHISGFSHQTVERFQRQHHHGKADYRFFLWNMMLLKNSPIVGNSAD
ncbi:asparagine synthase (glutamine-hydrolyzing) [Curvivirga aplysinae]|uniref:asparagine synthase (glutamine-hydrolyzing) n=1 Tax=Curvivirga aplysinae TaxID=2529852 RepID=UPI0012BC11AE|nr:asparagine synthase (glutamine-hydrolyzing) [Curvivirga aplysinae]MTI09482.1 asparagine synthase (glutamine-hydrolyzing) [Curvivirga aplysinae]